MGVYSPYSPLGPLPTLTYLAQTTKTPLFSLSLFTLCSRHFFCYRMYSRTYTSSNSWWMVTDQIDTVIKFLIRAFNFFILFFNCLILVFLVCSVCRFVGFLFFYGYWDLGFKKGWFFDWVTLVSSSVYEVLL